MEKEGPFARQARITWQCTDTTFFPAARDPIPRSVGKPNPLHLVGGNERQGPARSYQRGSRNPGPPDPRDYAAEFFSIA